MPITINKKTDRIFMAIAKQNKHSFLMFGVYEGSKVRNVLCRVGKWFDLSSREGILRDEGVTRHAKGHSRINYQAYDITYEQYCEFVRTLEALQEEKAFLEGSNQKYTYFKPTQFDENQKDWEEDEVELEQNNKPIFPSGNGVLGRAGTIATSSLGVGNNCRHAAIGLVEEVQGVSISAVSLSVSSLYFRDLPCTTHLDYGKPSKLAPFYVLPIPPHAYPELDDKKQKILIKLYKHMESMLSINSHSLVTQTKFAHLKELYNDTLGLPKELGLHDLLTHITEWKEEHRVDLSALRRDSWLDRMFTRKAKTMSIIEKIEQDLQKSIDEEDKPKPST